MKCLYCKENMEPEPQKLRVLRTRDYGDEVERDRRCPVCQNTTVTVELPVSLLEDLRKRAERAEARLEALGEGAVMEQPRPGSHRVRGHYGAV